MFNLYIKRIKVTTIGNGFVVALSIKEFTDPVYDVPSKKEDIQLFFATEKELEAYLTKESR